MVPKVYKTKYQIAFLKEQFENGVKGSRGKEIKVSAAKCRTIISEKLDSDGTQFFGLRKKEHGGGGVARAAVQGLLFLARSSEEKRKGVGGVDVDEAGAVSTTKKTRLALDAGTALCGGLLPRFGRATAAKVAPHVPTFGDLARMSKSQIETTCHEIGGNLKIWTAKFDQWRAAVTVKLGMELVAEGDEVHAENNGKE